MQGRLLNSGDCRRKMEAVGFILTREHVQKSNIKGITTLCIFCKIDVK